MSWRDTKQYGFKEFAKLPPDGSKQVTQLVREMSEALKGRHPLVQGTAIARIVSFYLAGHARDVRPAVRDALLQLADGMIADNEAMIFGDEQRPEGWEKPQ